MTHNGPWRKAQYDDVYPGYNDDENDILDAKGRLVATVTEWEDEGTPNACLVEAAPEMLQLLDEFRHHLVNHPLGDGLRDTFERTCRIVEELKGGGPA